MGIDCTKAKSQGTNHVNDHNCNDNDCSWSRSDVAHQLKMMRLRLAEDDEKHKRELLVTKLKFEQKMREYSCQQEEKLRLDLERVKSILMHQLTLVVQSENIIEYLREENTKLQQQRNVMNKRCNLLSEKNARLNEDYTLIKKNIDDVIKYAIKMEPQNAKISQESQKYKKEMTSLRSELKLNSALYNAEARACVAFIKTLTKIEARVQENSIEENLVKDIEGYQVHTRSKRNPEPRSPKAHTVMVVKKEPLSLKVGTTKVRIEKSPLSKQIATVAATRDLLLKIGQIEAVLASPTRSSEEKA